MAKSPFLRDWQNPPPALAQALKTPPVYRFTPGRVLFIDNASGFSHREEIPVAEDLPPGHLSACENGTEPRSLFSG
ncbi:MAG TPA: hypothetical protein VN848_09380 [Gemmatimonadales bacterium]|nr:hypothetical protein [Gemmatimonadales bacterium]